MSLIVQDLRVHFQTLEAVRGVSFTLQKGQSVGIVGESGSGKTALAQAINRLTPGTLSGEILFEGHPVLRPGKEIGMIFQDPLSSLNPTMKIGAQIAEGLIYHKMASKAEARARALGLLQRVGISHPESRIDQYPHQLSGGMRQRVLIAIAIACRPKLLIADEPTTALDITTQHQILELLSELKEESHMSLLLISHDFDVIQAICERVLVMYAGKIVEQGPVQEILNHPRHPYTQLLLKCLPRLDHPKSHPLTPIEGSPPNLAQLPKGCAFQERCPYTAIRCKEEPSGDVACWRAHAIRS